MKEEITIDELLSLKNPIIYDIRSYEKYYYGHIPQAKWINVSELLAYPEHFLVKNKKYYFYCDSGKRSSILVKQLNVMGYSAVNVIGGYQNYL